MKSPAIIAGVTILVKLIPPAFSAVTSESEDNLPKATRFERSRVELMKNIEQDSDGSLTPYFINLCLIL